MRSGESIFAGGGEMGRRIRAMDWSATPLGPIAGWPEELKTAVRIMLASRQPFWIGWGPELTKLYNDPYLSIIGGKHPDALGKPSSEVWAEIWDIIEPMLATALGGHEGTYVESQRLIMERHGFREETFYTYSYSPIPLADGTAGGIICANTDDTARVVSERQLAVLHDVAAASVDARSGEAACEQSARALDSAPDLPFALIYVRGDDDSTLRLAATSGIGPGHLAAPLELPRKASSPWPVHEVRGSREHVLVEDLAATFGAAFESLAEDPPVAAALLPIRATAHAGATGVLIAGLNPLRRLDGGYRSFLTLVAGQIGAGIANADAYERERERAEELEQLDRAKTSFFAGVSHEFRTPLTLMLGPIEQMRSGGRNELPEQVRGELDLVHRNALRLLKLVNTMLDFSRIEAGRIEANYQAVDLAAFTAELASAFRSVIETAGLRFAVDCRSLDEAVFVDRDMWEKVVFNLLSNAHKYTHEGEVAITIDSVEGKARLTVRDTGVGIPPGELGLIFDRFHRVKDSRGRTHEGTGIGLSLVRELVLLHGGDVTVRSELDVGSRFEVTLPFGSDHLDPRWINRTPVSRTRIAADAYIEEGMRWLPDDEESDPAAPSSSRPARVDREWRPRVLFADDNADMRDYVRQLLRGQFDVQTVVDGQAALEAARADPPDLVLSDVMMPRLDGVGLLRALRDDPVLRDVPIVLVSARAGEEARIEGLAAGADDYLVKPFSGRELTAMVDSHARTGQLRRAMNDALRRNAEREAFRASLVDAIRPIEDPAALRAVVARLLGLHLGVNRSAYAEFESDGVYHVVERDFAADVPSVAGRHRLDDYGSTIADSLRAGQALAEPDAAANERLSAEERARYADAQIGAHITVPLVRDGRLVSFLGVHQAAPRAWTAEEVALVAEVAERTWAAVERLKGQMALRESEEQARRIAAQEHRIALSLQQAMLPKGPLDRPQIEIAARYETGSDHMEVGGDWYDVFPLPSGRTGIVVGDVVGHGLAAAASMGRMRTAAAALAAHAEGPGQLLVNLDAFLATSGASDFATAWYGVFDPATGTLRYATAAHPPILMVSPEGLTRWLDEGRSPPLLGAGDPRPEAAVRVEPGATLVVYTDGLIERRHETLDEGLARLERAVQRAHGRPVEEVCDRLMGELAPPDQRSDDVVVMCLRFVHSSVPRFHRVFPARPEELRVLRREIATWLVQEHLGGPRQADLQITVGEACSNAIEHAYRDGVVGEVEVEIRADDRERFFVRVKDSGSWRTPATAPSDRGRGTTILEGLTDQFARHTDRAGTVVTYWLQRTEDALPTQPRGAPA